MLSSAIVCNTPLQVLGAINIVVNDVAGTRSNTDLFITGNFRDADGIYDRIQESNLFSTVVRCWPKAKKSGKLHTLKELTNSSAIWAAYHLSDSSILGKSYHQIFVGDNDLVGIALNLQSEKADILVYDDGIDTYSGNCILGRVSGTYRLIGKPLHLGVFGYRIKAVFVNCKSFCHTAISPNIEQLPLLNEDNPAVLLAKTIFHYRTESQVLKKRFILLGQPMEEIPGYNGKTFSSMIPATVDSSEFLYRAHPRQQDLQKEKFELDSIGNMWELECIFGMRNEHVLIGYYSTAQMTPKLIANKEPYLIFLYKLFLNNSDMAETKKYEKIIAALQAVYAEKHKIFIPDTVEDFYGLLEKF